MVRVHTIDVPLPYCYSSGNFLLPSGYAGLPHPCVVAGLMQSLLK